MTPDPLAHSLVLVTDYRVPDPARVWPLLQRSRDSLAHLGAHHVLVYTSAVDRGRVLAVMAIRAEQPVVDLLRDEAFMAWFDAVGVDDIPAVFAGSLVERIDLSDGQQRPADEPPTPASLAEPPGVVVAAVAEVGDAQTLIDHVHATAEHFTAAGIRKILIFQAFDNPREVFMLQVADEKVAESGAEWINQPEFASDWITRAGVGIYPPVFVGRLAHLMRIGDDADTAEEPTR
ncbi:fatty-acid--CoA ligase [Mycolicibacter longobardus]|uniref:Fatty-acid--CoA ligase n=1 Tax=Mycolicibacter longobardus TaxID=1108812 RepID=A0A1X1YI56_9MYCO|nr:fatty-acid--CoA ligase [Mycolicibacter longobardus]MCV7385842.1 fatty-acid--CoA ligase [Mycolicibacter longobardus]ORW10703.1 fatty-acid--CoA ligase [Mycolicibacter longobardus]